ncbi:hypothetical protein [Sphingomonas hengshuiensis]|uniref:Uncharacterized protein n=1 Tax=Sphingomonas hengshuiensis TaxID=1609977 RepID=A0A7U4J8T5_9SPHN|nr:hypothetical protein [Sphingomonas hengshuiensis]AJP72277.1 hypothetical protein TS85_11495 [Sphingomonas hengshuiensis]
MTRRTFGDIDAQARADERVGVVRHAAAHADRVRAAVARGAIDADTGALTIRHVAAFADEVTTGLHVGGADSPATRRVVRMMLDAAGLLGRRGGGSRDDG